MTEIERYLREELEKEKEYSKALEVAYLRKLEESHQAYLNALKTVILGLEKQEEREQEIDNSLFNKLMNLEQRLNALQAQQKREKEEIEKILDRVLEKLSILSS